ncbi:DUF2076 domain-containing protein [Thiotrichales bacterium 19S9-12]|nr:DUF2076 domain-containing protein [Thiotrichales bacterium 19S9-11]MCF6812584.1 DUF2076 domain-containing protein [Thiotrichales bacterium 19S9-12]
MAMANEDKQLINSLAQRLHQGNTQLQKDPEAEVMIKNEIERAPNAVYQLTQAVLLQEHALQNAQSQIQMLQQQINALQTQQQPRRGFLNNLFGGGMQQPAPRAMQQPNQGFQPGYQQQGAYQQNHGHYGGSSFLRSAATTAVGVAGGMALFQGVNSLFSGGQEAVASGVDAMTGARTDMTGQAQDFASDPQALTGDMDAQSEGMFGGFGDGSDFGGGDWF